jgi:hypothetical protein
MAYRITMSELGIANDDTAFEGRTPADILNQLVPHLKEHHGIELPDMGDYLTGGAGAILPARANAALPEDRGVIVPAPVPNDEDDAGVRLIMTRLAEKLNMRDSGLRADSDLDPRSTTG